jgi:SHS2 domain-containing protein
MRAGFEERPHTADRALRVWAADLPALFTEAARGMYFLMEMHLAPAPRSTRVFETQAPDPESLLVSFLSELLFLLENERLAFDRFEIHCEATALHVQMSGAPFQSLTGLVKAVTYHNLIIQRKKGRYEAEIVFDV